MTALSIALLVCGTVVFVWFEAKPLLQRRLVISEMRAGFEAQRVENERLAALKPSLKDDDPMPQEFVEWAMQESSEWAREDKLARMRELYDRLRDWEKVRRAMMAEDNAHIKSTF